MVVAGAGQSVSYFVSDDVSNFIWGIQRHQRPRKRQGVRRVVALSSTTACTVELNGPTMHAVRSEQGLCFFKHPAQIISHLDRLLLIFGHRLIQSIRIVVELFLPLINGLLARGN